MLVVLAVAGVAARAVHWSSGAWPGAGLVATAVPVLPSTQSQHTHTTLHTGNTIETQ